MLSCVKTKLRPLVVKKTQKGFLETKLDGFSEKVYTFWHENSVVQQTKLQKEAKKYFWEYKTSLYTQSRSQMHFHSNFIYGWQSIGPRKFSVKHVRHSLLPSLKSWYTCVISTHQHPAKYMKIIHLNWKENTKTSFFGHTFWVQSEFTRCNYPIEET